MSATDFLSSLARLYPSDRLLVQPAQVTARESDALTAYRTRPIAAVIPETQQEVIQTIQLCHRFEAPFVARGSGTSTQHRSSTWFTRKPLELSSPQGHPDTKLYELGVLVSW
jgi:hypothetical protein